jgi:perosamine synthetase
MSSAVLAGSPVPVSKNAVSTSPASPNQAFREVVPLSSPDVDDQDRERVMEVLRGRTLSLGPMLPAFEESLAAAAGTRFAVAVNSGTSALHLCVKGAGIADGDEVITSPFSFVASSNCLLFERAVPKFVDIDLDTYNINTAAIADAITPRTKGILPVHAFGRPCDMNAINAIASRQGLTVIEDSCEAIGATVDGRPAGGLGHAGVFAFYPNKQITTGEGGAVVTNDENLAALCRSWRNQGRGAGSAWLQHERLGYNYRLSDINCALGLGQVARLASILAARQRVVDMYRQKLAGLPHVIPPPPAAPGTSISWFVFVVRLQDEFTAGHRNQILATLRAGGIGCSNYFAPIHLQTFYREAFHYRKGDFPVTEHAADRTIALPFFNHLTESQVSFVVDALSRAIDSLQSPSVSVPSMPIEKTDRL